MTWLAFANDVTYSNSMRTYLHHDQSTNHIRPRSRCMSYWSSCIGSHSRPERFCTRTTSVLTTAFASQAQVVLWKHQPVEALLQSPWQPKYLHGSELGVTTGGTHNCVNFAFSHQWWLAHFVCSGGRVSSFFLFFPFICSNALRCLWM